MYFIGNQTCGLGVPDVMLYQLRYRNTQKNPYVTHSLLLVLPVLGCEKFSVVLFYLAN